MWEVVDAINQTKELDITFPSTYKEQEAVANEFKTRSSAGFNNCAGCVDGILIWIHKPSKPAFQEMGIGGKKFFCGRKKKFGLNMQAVCDARRRFLDVEIGHPGATFALSGLHTKLEGTNPQNTQHYHFYARDLHCLVTMPISTQITWLFLSRRFQVVQNMHSTFIIPKCESTLNVLLECLFIDGGF